jgi:predicted dehydrogenase
MTNRHATTLIVLLVLLAVTRDRSGAQAQETAPPIRFIILDPGHFHAALPFQRMHPGVDARVEIYAPAGPDLFLHLRRQLAYNERANAPTDWRLDIHTGPDFLERMLAERPGTAVAISGRNRDKIARIRSSIAASLHVLADKPWILKAEDLPALDNTLAEAEAKGLVAYDMMTERFEITNVLQRALVSDPAVCGRILPGTLQDPAVYMESVHHIMKTVAGAPNLRPSWFFDVEQQGAGLNDVGTHLVDLAQWTLFPEQALDYRRDIQVLAAWRWPTLLSRDNLLRVTGERDLPTSLRAALKNDQFEYECNTLAAYQLRGIHVRLNVIWDWEAPAGGGDTHFAFYKGDRARIEVRQGKSEKYRPELYITPNRAKDKVKILVAARRKLQSLASEYPDLSIEDRGQDLRVVIPDRLRAGHEHHFAAVMERFLAFLRDPKALPAWERPNMLAKYFVTTAGVELSRRTAPRVASRLAP